MLTGNDLLKAVRELKKDLDTMKKSESSKTEITIDGDNIIYNGVKYQKVQEESKKNTLDLTAIIADTLENILASYADYSEVYDNAYHISEVLVDVISDNIPDYSDWVEVLKEFPNQTLPQEKSDLLRLGWNCYCKKMWDMINE